MTLPKQNAEFRTALFEQLAERLRQAGATHPVAAAVALVARGDVGSDRASFAASAGCSEDMLDAIEGGEMPLVETLNVLLSVLPADLDALLNPLDAERGSR